VLAGAAIRLAAAMLDKVENRLNRHLLLAQVPKVENRLNRHLLLALAPKVAKAVRVN
jgi:hypothetical protein